MSVSLLFVSTFVACASEPAAARWEGAVQIPGRELKLVVDFDQNPQGQWVGSAIVPGFGIKGAPLVDIEVKSSAVSFTIKGALDDPRFQGHLAEDGAMTGDYKQAGNTAPFTLRKVGPAQVEPLPESTSVQKELEGEWQGEMSYAGNQFHVTIKLANQTDGKAGGQFVIVIVGRRENVHPISLVTQEGDLLTVEVPAMGATYEGRFLKDRSAINGALMQGGIEIPLTLHPPAKSGPQP